MAYSASRLPNRFPEGTKFVIEGRRGQSGTQVFSRYIEMPDGTCYPLPSRPAPQMKDPPRRSRRARRG